MLKHQKMLKLRVVSLCLVQNTGGINSVILRSEDVTK